MNVYYDVRSSIKLFMGALLLWRNSPFALWLLRNE